METKINNWVEINVNNNIKRMNIWLDDGSGAMDGEAMLLLDSTGKDDANNFNNSDIYIPLSKYSAIRLIKALESAIECGVLDLNE